MLLPTLFLVSLNIALGFMWQITFGSLLELLIAACVRYCGLRPKHHQKKCPTRQQITAKNAVHVRSVSMCFDDCKAREMRRKLLRSTKRLTVLMRVLLISLISFYYVSASVGCWKPALNERLAATAPQQGFTTYVLRKETIYFSLAFNED